MNQIIKGMGFHHIALKASDFDKSLEFYKSLGLTEKVCWGEGDGRAVMLDMGDGGCIELFAGGEQCENNDKRFFHLALRADDVDFAYQTALNNGAKPKTPPVTVSPEGASRPLTMRIAFVYGPDGEELEFFKEM